MKPECRIPCKWTKFNDVIAKYIKWLATFIARLQGSSRKPSAGISPNDFWIGRLYDKKIIIKYVFM